MKTYIFICLLAVASNCTNQSENETGRANNDVESGDHHAYQHPADEEKSKPKSPPQMAMASVGDSHVHIEYNAPSKKGRMIFGGLVAYNEVWVTGAHNATSISFSEDVKIGGTDIKAGKYGLFTIPGKDEWIIIINSNWDQHLADDYDPAEDVVRIKAAPTKLTEPLEMLTFGVNPEGEKNGTVSISWDDIMVRFQVSDL